MGAGIPLRVRSNANFHAPRDARPLILIGNGTGLASLRALRNERMASGQRCNWLVFGERQAADDFHYREQVEAWLQDGQLERVDLAWSRDQSERIHGQRRLRDAAGEFLRWHYAGADVCVCGNLDGMAPGVDRVLRDLLGDIHVVQWREQGRYLRDVN